jgi:hypothetical protein
LSEETENWIEQRSPAVEEWSTRNMGKKERLEIDKAGETSNLETLGSDVSTEASEPGSVQARRTLDLKNEDKEESLLAANSYPSHHHRYTKTKERMKRIEQFMMTKLDRDIKVPNNGGLLPDQSCDGDDQHGEGKDHQPHDRPDMEAALVIDTVVRQEDTNHKIPRYKLWPQLGQSQGTTPGNINVLYNIPVRDHICYYAGTNASDNPGTQTVTPRGEQRIDQTT